MQFAKDQVWEKNGRRRKIISFLTSRIIGYPEYDDFSVIWSEASPSTSIFDIGPTHISSQKAFKRWAKGGRYVGIESPPFKPEQCPTCGAYRQPFMPEPYNPSYHPCRF